MGRTADMAKNRYIPYVTLGLIAVNVIYFIIVALGGSPSDPVYMLSRGADYAPFVFKEHEFWRLVTSMFLHFSFRHLSGNMLYLGLVGFSYEKITGHLKFFLIYFLSGIGGNVVSAAYHQLTGNYVVSAGASGAVYGIIAIVIYLSFISRKRFPPATLLYRVAIMLVFLFYSNFVSGRGIDVAAHIGGLVFGGILCFLLLPFREKKKDT